MFDLGGRAARHDDDAATVRAAELGERVLDELTRPDHSWWKIAALSRQLNDLATQMASP